MSTAFLTKQAAEIALYPIPEPAAAVALEYSLTES